MPAQPARVVTSAAIYERTSIIVGEEGLDRLHRANMFVAGVGGVGGHLIEALVRGGVGAVTIVDGDVVMTTNKNRQLVALDSTVGQSKVAVMAERLRDINRQCRVTTIDGFLLGEDMRRLLAHGTPGTAFGSAPFTHVVDCIDSVDCKIALLRAAVDLKIPCFASGGAGGRSDPQRIVYGDLMDTEGDALLRLCRRALRGAPGDPNAVGWGCVRCVFSSEVPVPPLPPVKQDAGGRDRSVNGTVSYMPPLFGLFLAGAVLRHAIDPHAEKKNEAEKKRRAKKDKSAVGESGHVARWAGKKKAT